MHGVDKRYGFWVFIYGLWMLTYLHPRVVATDRKSTEVTNWTGTKGEIMDRMSRNCSAGGYWWRDSGLEEDFEERRKWRSDVGGGQRDERGVGAKHGQKENRKIRVVVPIGEDTERDG